MSSIDTAHPSEDAIAVLKLLRDHHNVLISGPPGTGKSRLLAEVRHWFKGVVPPSLATQGAVVFPKNVTQAELDAWLPSPTRKNRKIWSMTFHQGTKYRDLVGGLVPRVSSNTSGFEVKLGPLCYASEHARSNDGAALLEIDEINRGPAVAVFGDTITAIESDKRLQPDGSTSPTTSTFRLMGADGDVVDYALPHHLYILTAMNEADTSVEPLDVAFLRRFQKYRLGLDEPALRRFLSLPTSPGTIVASPNSEAEAFEAVVQAWAAINRRIELGRGAEFQLGHGIFMESSKDDLPSSKDDALLFVAEIWNRIYTHVTEVFFGDTRGIAAVIGANSSTTPYKLDDSYFVDAPVFRLSGPSSLNPTDAYRALCTAAEAS